LKQRDVMMTPNTTELLKVWEQGAGQPIPIRALLLMRSVVPEQDGEALAHWNIGQRDRLLLNLRDALFGPEVHCLTDCTNCGEPIELDFRIDDIRVPHGESGRAYHAAVEGYEVRFRLPDSTDLLALDGGQPAQAERQLLARCVLYAWTKDCDVEAATLPDAVLTAVSRKMGEADPQAEVLLEVSCPACSSVSPAPFDIVSHLWTELDAWARRMLREVHTLATVYGWSEAAVLRMNPVRRRVYLDLVGG
jgi:hypothetical protein